MTNLAADLVHAQCGCAPGRRRANGTSHSAACNAFQERLRTELAAAYARGRADMQVEAASCAAQWQSPSAVRLAAGEMTAQELRTAQAVAGGIERAIRALTARPDEELRMSAVDGPQKSAIEV